jgi:hypothetical protein
VFKWEPALALSHSSSHETVADFMGDKVRMSVWTCDFSWNRWEKQENFKIPPKIQK